MEHQRLLYVVVLMTLGLSYMRSYAQQPETFRCGFEEYEKRYLQARGISRADIEAHLQRQIAKRRLGKNLNNWALTEEEVLTIPVVFHILRSEKWKHSTQVSTAYVKDEEIRNQVDTLTMHFRNKHKNRVDVIPAFKGMGRDIKVEFVLAKRDPDGLPTDGIMRSGEDVGYIPPEFADPAKPNLFDILDKVVHWSPIWDPERYMNVYILPLDNSGAISTGSIPLNTTSGAIPSHIHGRGLATGTDISLPLITLNPFLIAREEAHGQADKTSGYLLIHEVGHYFGLLHTFEGNCNGDDYCDDTPSQKIAANPYSIQCHEITADNASINTCGSLDMTQNYMNYTNLECYRLFTPCQKERMRTVLNESFRRHRLAENSLALTAPVASRADSLRVIKAEVSELICPTSSTYSLSAIVANFGTNALSTYEVGVYSGDTELKKLKVTGENLATWERDTLVLEGIARGADPAKLQTLEVRVTLIGDKTIASDNTYIANYRLYKQVYFPSEVSGDGLPLHEGFEARSSKSEHWVLNPATEAFTRQEAQMGSQGHMLVFPFNAALDAKSNKGVGAPYAMYSPILNITQPKAGHMLALRFKHSYTPDRKTAFDAIVVKGILDACGGSPRDTLLQSTWGADLATTWFNQGNNKPDSADWRTSTIPLQSLIGNKPFQAQIDLISGRGNPLYLDDIELVYIKDAPTFLGVVQRFPIVCSDWQVRGLARGYVELNSFNSDPVPCSKKLWARKLKPRVDTRSFPLNHLGIGDGVGDCIASYTLAVPYGFGGFNLFALYTAGAFWYDSPEPKDAIYYGVTFYNKTRVSTAAIGHDFSAAHEEWITLSESPSRDANHEAHFQRDAAAGYLKGAFYKSGRHANYMLTSPLVNLSAKTKPRLYFDVSYAPRVGAGAGERLRVMVLDTCDIYSSKMIYNKAGDDLRTANAVSGAWQPTQASHWHREVIDISAYTRKGPIQLIFLASDNGGNNLYLDNVYIGENQPPANLLTRVSTGEEIEVYPNPSKQKLVIKFPFAPKASVRLTLIDANGKVIATHTQRVHAPVLEVGLPEGATSAFYFLQIEGGGFATTRRILLE